MTTYRLSLSSEADLAAIFWDGLERFGATQTERYLERLEAAFAYIAAFPEAARLRTEIVPPVRALPVEAHIIVYDIEATGAVIQGIRSARENWIAAPAGDDTP